MGIVSYTSLAADDADNDDDGRGNINCLHIVKKATLALLEYLEKCLTVTKSKEKNPRNSKLGSQTKAIAAAS